MHPGTRRSGLDYNQGGCRYNWTGATGVGLANSADTLAVIDRLIYQTKQVGWDELKAALRSNWVGFETLRRKCIAVPKYGMDEDLPDQWAKRCSDLLVRVGGYSALFTRLSPELQDAIIARVEQSL